MSDPAHRETDKILAKLEKRITKEYKQAIEEIEAKLSDYFRRFETKDKKWREWVKAGKKTKEEYKQWKIGQLAVGDRWESMRNVLVQDLHNASNIARNMIYGDMPNVYAVNHDYATYEIEHGTNINTDYTLYSHEAARQALLSDRLLPPPGKTIEAEIAAGKAERWNHQLIQSVMMQAILQGESIPHMASRIANAVGDSNRKSAIRNARTMTTGVENAGRVDSYKRAEKKGIDLEKQWIATLDGRTRHQHRILDGQTVGVDDSFTVDGYKIRFPGDPEAPGYLIYNCRCTLISQLKGFPIDIHKRQIDPKLGNMTYEEWKKDRRSRSNKITLPEEKEKAIKNAYINEYRNGSF